MADVRSSAALKSERHYVPNSFGTLILRGARGRVGMVVRIDSVIWAVSKVVAHCFVNGDQLTLKDRDCTVD